ncbi:MAG: hypothetical protein U0586_17215 [Candidatus Brocadiaceae bacterium]
MWNVFCQRYIEGNCQFSQKIRAVAETFVAMGKSLDQEKAAMNKLRNKIEY